MRLATLPAILLFIGSTLFAQPAWSDESVDVVVKTNEPRLSASAADGTGGDVTKRVTDDTVVVSVAASSAEAAAAAIATKPGVIWAEPDYKYTAALEPDDTCYVSTCSDETQWGPRQIGAPTAWDASTGNPSVKVAILDSGVDVNHPDLAGRVVNGPNFSTDPDAADIYGHGTHVAGIVGASTDNAAGVAGMSWSASMVSVKVLAEDSGGRLSAVASDAALGLRWAADNGARVVNMSFGGPDNSTVLAEAVNYAQSRGVLLVAAAGNAGNSTESYPAAYPGVVAVGASDKDDRLASLSNRGPWVDVLAPGVSVVSTWPTNLDPVDPYSVQSGTSMSAPFVTGAAVLLWSARPYLSGAGVAERMLGTARQVSGSGTFVASGRLDAGAALTPVGDGYRLAASDGGVFTYGNAAFNGSAGSIRLNRPIVTMATSGATNGYWLVASDGGVFSYGGAPFHGSAGGTVLNRPVVGAATTRFGNGYWLVASDGGVFSYGDAIFHGSTGGVRLNSPIVAMVPTVTGRGYWLVASDGGVFSFGDAAFYGSAGNLPLNAPIVGAARTAEGNGYWLVGSDGGVFSFGDAVFHGSAGSLDLNEPVVGMSASPSGEGYWFTGADGGIFSYGDAEFHGSAGSLSLNSPIVSMAAQP